MSMILPGVLNYRPLRGLPDVEPFSIRSGASYEDIQWSTVAFIRDQLTPYVETLAGKIDANSAGLIDAVNEVTNNLAASVAAALNQAAAGSYGSITAPAPTGVAATDTQNIKDAIAYAQAHKVDLFMGGGVMKYKFNEGFKWDLSRGSWMGVGEVDWDCTSLTSGFALEIFGSPAATSADTSSAPSGGNYYAGRPVTNRVGGFRIQGPGVESTTADGVLIDQDHSTAVKSVEPAQGSVERLFIRGFRDGLVHAEGSFCMHHYSVFVQSCFRRGVSLVTQGTAGGLGENIAFFGCTIAGTKNSAGTGVGLYTDPTAIADANFFGVSFDYNDIEIDHSAGDITLSACHLENNSPNAMVKLSAGANTTTLTVLGGSWRASGTNAAVRDHIVEVKSTSTGDVLFSVFGGGGGPSTLDTRFFKNLSSTLVAVEIQNFNWIGGRHMGVGYTTYGDDLNLLSNGNFESSQAFAASNIGGWQAGTADGITRAINNSHPRRGLYALNITGNGTTGTDVTKQMVAIAPGRVIAASAEIGIWDYTAGSMQVMVVFYGADRTTALDTYRVTSGLSAIVNPYQTAIAKMVPPKSAAYAEVQIQAINWNGYFTVDSVQLTQL